MKALLIVLIFSPLFSFAQETDLSDLEDVKSHLFRTRWQASAESESNAEFLLLFSEGNKGEIIGSNIPNHALDFELILDSNKAHILWFNSSKRCISTEIKSLDFGKLTLDIGGEEVAFTRYFWFITGCPSF